MALTTRHRQELLAIVSLLVGLFVGLTLIPWDITGLAGRLVGRFLWTSLGVGAVFLPVMGLGLALAGFGRLPLDTRRAAVLLGALVVLVPFAIALATGVRGVGDFPADYADWTTTQRLSGIVPAVIVVGITGVVGTAGAVIFGLLAVSALTMYTVDWHPFRRLAPRVRGVRQAVPWSRPEPPREEPDEEAEAEERRPAAKKLMDRLRGRRRPEEAPDELPPLDLLSGASGERQGNWDSEIERQGQVLIDTLGTFRVEGSIVGRTTGWLRSTRWRRRRG
jgi:hypothetical protein